MEHPDATPRPGFVAKLKAPDGTLHYLNICSHPSVERPLDGCDREVEDSLLRARGVDNLRVPLLTGTPRTVEVPDSEQDAICFDVVFSPAVLAVALDDESAKAASMAPGLCKFVRVRLVDLAIKNAEEELGYKLGRNYTLPRGLTFKGGVGGGRQPVPLPALRQLSAQKAAMEAAKAASVSSGPWRSKKAAAGLSTRNKIEEINVGVDLAQHDRRAAAPILKKGFLNTQVVPLSPSWRYVPLLPWPPFALACGLTLPGSPPVCRARRVGTSTPRRGRRKACYMGTSRSRATRSGIFPRGCAPG